MTAIISRIIKMSYTGRLMKTTIYPQLKQPYLLILFIALSGSSLPVSAEIDLTGLYSGLQYSSSEYKSTNGSTETASNGHIKAKLGKTINENLSAEGQFGMTTNSNDKLGTFTYGGYLRGSKDYGQYKPYGLIGFSGYYSYADNSDSQSETGGSLGVGLEIFGSKDITITFEYLRLMDKTINGADVTFDTFGVGFTYYFTEDTSYFNKNRNKINSIRY